MEQNIRLLCVVAFAVIGVSHLLQPKAWIDFVKVLITKRHTGAFINGFITLPMGLLIVAFHNVWTGLAVMLTVLGWFYIAKSVICFCFPAISLRSMRRVEKNNTKEFQMAGGMMLFIAVILLISMY